MDSVNPDYVAAWILRHADMPAWIYQDNYLSEAYKYPLLNSLYGGNSITYLAILFFKLFGFGAVEVRMFHCMLAVALLLSMNRFLLQWKTPKIFALIFTCLLASDPTYVFVWRTQYYLQLYPLIFLFLGLGTLGSFVNAENNQWIRPRPLLLSGMLIGFSAYSYFIFAIYAAVLLVCFYSWSPNKQNRFKSCMYLASGVCLGFSPYIYAHLSIILNTNLHSYIESIKSLQTAYGVVDNNQGGLFDRMHIVFNRLSSLLAGTGVESVIFGDSPTHLSRTMFAGSLIVAIPVIYLGCRRLFGASRLVKLDGHSDLNKIYIFSFLLSCFALHAAFGVVMGRPLGTQHYIMLMPLAYAAIAILYSVVSPCQLPGLTKNALKSVLMVVSILAITLNLSISQKISGRLYSEGGRKLYSDAINIAGAYVNGLPTETAILCPQWGYWMGFAIIAGPRFPMYESPSIEAMENRILHDPALLKHKKFILVLGQDYFRGDDLAKTASLETFASHTGLLLNEVTTISGRNGADKVLIAHLTRN